jgi:hypothetical protein
MHPANGQRLKMPENAGKCRNVPECAGMCGYVDRSRYAMTAPSVQTRCLEMRLEAD